MKGKLLVMMGMVLGGRPVANNGKESYQLGMVLERESDTGVGVLPEMEKKSYGRVTIVCKFFWVIVSIMFCFIFPL